MLAQASGSTPAAESVNAAYHALLTLSQGLPDIAAEQTRARLTSLQAELQTVIVAGGDKSWNHAAFVCLLQYIASTPPAVVPAETQSSNLLLVLLTIAFSCSTASHSHPSVDVYPVTDYQHSITTPALLVAGQFLALYPFRTTADVSAGLLLCSVLLSVRYHCVIKYYETYLRSKL